MTKENSKKLLKCGSVWRNVKTGCYVRFLHCDTLNSGVFVDFRQLGSKARDYIPLGDFLDDYEYIKRR